MAITVDKSGKETSGIIDDDVVQPFSLDATDLRGRMIRMGSVLEQIIGQHNYPLPVSYLLSEALTVSLLLSSMLKYDGIFTLQIQSKGPIRTLVTDVNTNGHVRAYAAFDEDELKDLPPQKDNNFYHLMHSGHIAFTVDQGEHMARYQGIVALEGESMLDAIQHYFEQSEQIKTSIRMAIHPQDDQWRAGAVMVQYIPEHHGKEEDEMRQEERQEDWNRTKILLGTCRDDELLAPHMHSADVLYRLFHEEGVRIYPATSIKHVCRCSRDRVEDVLLSLSDDDMRDAKNDDGEIDITCEFCGKSYMFHKEDLDQLSDKK